MTGLTMLLGHRGGSRDPSPGRLTATRYERKAEPKLPGMQSPITGPHRRVLPGRKNTWQKRQLWR